MHTLRDLDRCAKLTLRAQGSALVLEVRAGDGRVASRSVMTEAQLLRASEALLTLPPQFQSAPPEVAPADNRQLESTERPTPGPAPLSHVELGAGAAVRLGGTPLFLAGGVGGFADVVVTPWLIGVSARWDITPGLLSEPTLMDYYLMSTAVGVRVGRRFELESTSLALLFGPNLVLERQDADDGQLDIGGTAADVRIDLGARLASSRRAPLCAFVSTDLELSPARLAKEHHAHPSLPALPSLSLGLGLGVQWSSP